MTSRLELIAHNTARLADVRARSRGYLDDEVLAGRWNVDCASDILRDIDGLREYGLTEARVRAPGERHVPPKEINMTFAEVSDFPASRLGALLLGKSPNQRERVARIDPCVTVDEHEEITRERLNSS